MTNPASLPPGFRFHPTDEELIIHYLKNRTSSAPCPVSIIAEVDIYKFDPWDLPGLNYSFNLMSFIICCSLSYSFNTYLCVFMQLKRYLEIVSGTSSARGIESTRTVFDQIVPLHLGIGRQPVLTNQSKEVTVPRILAWKRRWCFTKDGRQKVSKPTGSCMSTVSPRQRAAIPTDRWNSERHPWGYRSDFFFSFVGVNFEGLLILFFCMVSVW